MENHTPDPLLLDSPHERNKREEQERTTIKKRLFLETLERSSGRINATCQHADISRATYYVWIKEDANFKENVEEITGRRGSVIRDLLMTKAIEGDVRALTYLDKKFNKEDKVEKESVVHIHYHKDKLEPPAPPRTLEDILYDSALKKKKLIEEGHMPHVRIAEEEEAKRKEREEKENSGEPWKDGK